MMDFKAAREALKQGRSVKMETADATYLIGRIGTHYAHLAMRGRIPLADVLAIDIEEPWSSLSTPIEPGTGWLGG